MLRGHSLAAKLSLPSCLGVVAGCVLASSAAAAPVVGPSGSAFYTPPSSLPAHGSLIWYRPASLNLVAGGSPVAYKAWTVLYSSQSLPGTADAVTGTVLVPTAAYAGGGTRPVVDYAVGTQGLSQSSSPSMSLITGLEYEEPDIVSALNKGYAVEVTDYAGYTNGGVPDYIVGSSEGHAVLDIALAATQIPGAGISSTAKTVTWGYSQGGQASAWAAQEWPSYAPSIALVGDASGGIPSDLNAVGTSLNGGIGAAFLLYSIIGLNQDYPSAINLGSYVNAAGVAAIKQAEGQSVFASLVTFLGKNIDAYTVNNPATGTPWTLAQLFAIPSIASVVAAQSLGTVPLTVPLFQYHSLIDEIVPLGQDLTLHSTYCAEGVKDDFNLYAGEHLLGDFEGSPDALAWIANRFVGAAAPDNC